MILNQVFDEINIGLVILDRDMKVQKWNRWMELHSGFGADRIVGSSIFNYFPDLNNKKFHRSCKSVFSFGNCCFFSQKLHHYLFPFKSSGYIDSGFEYMQQSCSMGPLRDENNVIQYLFIHVQDVTEVALYEQKLVDMNLKDGLTGIYNRRFMEVKLREEFDRCSRYNRDFSIIMFDIDHFKNVNDEYGHQCGDFILKSISSRVLSIIRNVDYLFRYGGEEFCCLLPETAMNNAFIVAERFRKAIMAMENDYAGEIVKVTISLGVAGMDKDIDSSDNMVKMADDALYKAKREGRNRALIMG